MKKCKAVTAKTLRPNAIRMKALKSLFSDRTKSYKADFRPEREGWGLNTCLTLDDIKNNQLL